MIGLDSTRRGLCQPGKEPVGDVVYRCASGRETDDNKSPDNDHSFLLFCFVSTQCVNKMSSSSFVLGLQVFSLYFWKQIHNKQLSIRTARWKVGVAGNLLVLGVVWFSLFPLITNLAPLWLFPPTRFGTCARIFRHTSLALCSLEKIIISQWPVYKCGKHWFTADPSSFILRCEDVWGSMKKEEKDHFKFCAQIIELFCGRLSHGLLCDSLLCRGLLRGCLVIGQRICLFSAVIRVCVMSDTQRIKMSCQAQTKSDGHACYTPTVTHSSLNSQNSNM